MPRVLLVESDAGLARSLVRVITGAGVSRLDVAPDPDQALVHATADDYDIVVADFDLGPGPGGGVAVLERLRQAQAASRSYIVISAVARTVPAWCTLVVAGDLTRLAALIAAAH